MDELCANLNSWRGDINPCSVALAPHLTTMLKIPPVFALATLTSLVALAPQPSVAAPAAIVRAPFGTMPDGKVATLYTLRNTRGGQVQITNYGATVTALRVPDKNGVRGDVVLGFDTLQGYLNGDAYFGAIVGRYGNRIAKGRFTLDGKNYTLATNNAPNHLHGGVRGFDKRLWNAKPLMLKEGPALELTLFSPNGQEGYPGNLNVRVRYVWRNDNALKIDYRAVTDAPTVINLTQHSYFNLKGAGLGTILDHQLRLNADRYTPIDPTSIPFGELAPVAATPFDFRQFHAIGALINEDNTQLKNGQGYDHNFVLNRQGGGLRLAATVREATSGREMRVYTTEPGVQFYSGNFLNGVKGKYGRVYPRRSGFCLETQHFPDSPNRPNFPSATLRPGQTYRQTTVYEFSTR